MHPNKKQLWRFNLNRQYSVKPQIENHIQDLISNGELIPGEQVCSCQELARINSVSKNTVNRAYSNLTEQNVLESYSRKGTYVAEPPVNEAEEQYSVPAAFSFCELHKTSALPAVYLRCLTIGSDAPHPAVIDMSKYIKTYKEVLASFPRNKPSNSFISERVPCAMSTLLGMRKIHVKPSQIAVLHGLTHALQMVTAMLVKPGDGVVMASPTDTHALFAFTKEGASLHFTGTDFQGMLTEQLEFFCQSRKIKVVYVRPAAEYPLMSMLSEARRNHLLHLARKYHFVIIEMNEDYEFSYKQALRPLVSGNHDGRLIHICPISQISAQLHDIGLVTGPVDFIAAFKRSAHLSGYRRDLDAEQVAMQMIGDKSLFHLAVDLRAYYRRLIEQLSFLLDNYLRNHAVYQLPSSGLSVGLRFNHLVDLKPALQGLEDLGYYSPDKYEEDSENQLYSHLRIGLGHVDMKKLEVALKLIQTAVQRSGSR